jgi:multiple sugar transport system permease protein
MGWGQAPPITLGSIATGPAEDGPGFRRRAQVLSTLDPGSPAARRGLSDISIRNLFIVPTIAFLIVFNIFPLIYSLGYSFTDFRASFNAPANFVGLQNYRDLLHDEHVWNNFSVTAKYVLLSVGGQVLVGFGVAMLLNRKIPFKGLITTLLLLPMMMSMVIVGLFWELLYSPSWGIVDYALRLEDFDWLSNPRVALYAIAITDIWMWSPFVMLLCLAGLSAIPQHLYEAAAIDRASRWYTFTRITLPLVTPLLLIAIIFRTMEAFKTFDLAFIMSTQETTELIAIKLYRLAFQEWQTGQSCALAYMVLIMVLAITNIYVKYLNRVKER